MKTCYSRAEEREGSQKDATSALARPSLPRAPPSAQSWRHCLWKDSSVSFRAIPVLGGGAAGRAGPAPSHSATGPDTELSPHLPGNPQGLGPGRRGPLHAAAGRAGRAVSRAVETDKRLCQKQHAGFCGFCEGAQSRSQRVLRKRRERGFAVAAGPMSIMVAQGQGSEGGSRRGQLSSSA